MVWFFQRDGKFLRFETRTAPQDGYELVITHPNGEERVERFNDSVALADRQRALESELIAEGWAGPHGRFS